MTSTEIAATLLESRAATFGALSDPIRLSILDHLSRGSRCVCELQEALEIAPNLLSYHLRILREAGLIEASRRGKWVDYRLGDDAIARVVAALPAPLLSGVMQ
jgi:ArsR family transcriptional regulator